MFYLWGSRGKVTALNKRDGNIVWTTKLPGGMGDDFVTLTCDDTLLYAAVRGEIHCMDIVTGNLIWTNKLKGYGIGCGFAVSLWISAGSRSRGLRTDSCGETIGFERGSGGVGKMTKLE